VEEIRAKLAERARGPQSTETLCLTFKFNILKSLYLEQPRLSRVDIRISAL